MSTVNPPKKRPSRRLLRPILSFSALIDQGFFIFAGIATLWLAWLVFREGLQTGSWWFVALFVVAWVITAYVALPRLHRVFSSLYVPNYFIGRTRAADGLLADPVNVAFLGREDQLHEAMKRAGWTMAEEITPRSVWKISIATIFRKSYASAPVSSAFLFGRRHDFAYQQEVGDSPSKRHHVRFWRCPKGWMLPGGHQVDWLAAATYDKGVGISFLTFQLTHRVDEDTDIERDYVIDTVKAGSKEVTMTLLKNFSTGYHSRNGGGDAIRTDGDLPVLQLECIKAVECSTERPRIILDTTAHAELPVAHATVLQDLWSRRPPTILLGSIVVVTVLCLMVAGIILDALHQSSLAEMLAGGAVADDVSYIVRITLIGMAIVELWLIRQLLAGSNRARIALLSVASGMVVTEALRVTVDSSMSTALAALATVGFHIMIVLLFSADSSRQFTKAHSSSKK